MWPESNDVKKEYMIEQRNRKEDQQLQPIGPVKEEVRAIEYRDLRIKKENSWTAPHTRQKDEPMLEESIEVSDTEGDDSDMDNDRKITNNMKNN